MMRFRLVSKGVGIAGAVLLALFAAGSASADGGRGEECPPFVKISPADGSTAPVDPTLTWSSAFGALRYEVCVDAEDDGLCGTEWTSVGTLREYVPAGLDAGTTYYWQVRAVTAWMTRYANGGAWWSFSTLADPPEAFGKDAPADLSSQPNDPTLSWGASGGASSYEYCYDTTNDGTCDGAWTSAGTGTSAALGGLDYDTTYYWQVRAVNAAGSTDADGGSWWSFTVPPDPSGKFGKTSPADLSFVAAGTTLAWEESSGATGYEYCYDEADDGLCDGGWISAGTSTGAEISGLINTRTYYWQVRAANGGGYTSADGGAWWSFTVRYQTFADVPLDHWAWSWIERLYTAGITNGCAVDPLRYCPEQSVLRSEMAVFLERSMNGPGYAPPAGTGLVFADVDLSHWAVNWIEQLYSDGITNGCADDPLRYCPEQSVLRSEMAVFLLRAEHGAAYAPPPATGTVFLDVPASHWAASWIEQLHAEGIVEGCGGGNYCPDLMVTRAEMAVFLVRAFDLP